LPYDPFGSMSWYKDYFNEFPFAMYYGNLFGMEVDQDEFETNLEDYNLTGSTFSIDFVLPPVLSDCVDGVELELQVGDMRIDIAGLFFDQQIDATVWASYRVPAKIATYKLESGETALKLELTGEPSFMSAEVSGLSSDLPVEAEPLLLDVMRDVVIAEFIDLFAAGALGGIYIPGLQIVEAFEGLPQENKTMYFEPSAFEEESGYTVIKGAFK